MLDMKQCCFSIFLKKICVVSKRREKDLLKTSKVFSRPDYDADMIYYDAVLDSVYNLAGNRAEKQMYQL